MLMMLSQRPVICFVILVAILAHFADASFMNWLFGDEVEDVENQTPANAKTGLIKDQSRFEMLSTDQKFLEFSKTLADLSPLDECYHIVVYSLKKRCSDLSEEELGKLSVQLLNCQSEAEERRVYPCTAKMSIAECTKHMDPTTWNSYQIVSNRARAMCYAAQQTQFRKMTELTVNQLVAQAGRQLQTMQDLQSGQEQLHAVTTDTMKKVYQGQEELMGNQQILRLAQKDIYSNIATNLRQLTMEKALISSGNRELAEMTERIKEKLDKATNQLLNQEEKQQVGHEEIMKDLQQIRQKATDVLGKIDKATNQLLNQEEKQQVGHEEIMKDLQQIRQKATDVLDDSSSHILQHHVDMMGHYNTTLGNLEKINQTISYIQSTITDMKSSFEKRLGWLAQILGGAEERINVLTIAVLHFGYFVVAAISAAFLQTPMVSRIILLIIVPLNAISEMKQGVSMDFTSMTLFIIITIATNWAIMYAIQTRRGRLLSGGGVFNGMSPLSLPSPVVPDPPPVTPITDVNGFIGGRPIGRLNSLEIQALTNTLERLYRSLNANPENVSVNDSGNDSVLATSTTGSPPRPVAVCPGSASTPINLPPTPMPSSSSAFSPVTSTRDDREVELASARRHLMQTLDRDTPSTSRSPSRSSRASTPRRRSSSRMSNSSISRPLCNGRTRTGQLCRLSAVTGEDYCHLHRASTQS